MECVRSGGDLKKVGGDSQYSKVVMCPDGCVLFRLTAKPLGDENFFEGKFLINFPRMSSADRLKMETKGVTL